MKNNTIKFRDQTITDLNAEVLSMNSRITVLQGKIDKAIAELK